MTGPPALLRHVTKLMPPAAWKPCAALSNWILSQLANNWRCRQRKQTPASGGLGSAWILADWSEWNRKSSCILWSFPVLIYCRKSTTRQRTDGGATAMAIAMATLGELVFSKKIAEFWLCDLCANNKCLDLLHFTLQLTAKSSPYIHN